MSQSPNLNLPFLEAGQAQKHVTHNEALRVLDAVVQLSVVAVGSSPPAEPADGERVIVGASPSGAFAGHANEIAAFQDGAWVFLAPQIGWRAWRADAGALVVWTGSAWIELETNGGMSFHPRGAWDSETSYSVGDLVEHQGFLFLSNIDDNLGNAPATDPPASSAEWTFFAVQAVDALVDLDDIEITDPQDEEILTYDAAAEKWRNAAPPAGGGAGALDDLADVEIAGPQEGEGLLYDATAGKWRNAELPAEGGGVPSSRVIATEHSLAGGGDLSQDRTLSLVNDAASPGANKVYGTDASGVRGWKDDPAGGGGDVTGPDGGVAAGMLASYADTTGKELAARLNAYLLQAKPIGSGGSGNVQLQISKDDNTSNTASVFFSRNLSGRAEFGLVESDDFKLKVSQNGSAWIEAMVFDYTTGNVRFPQMDIERWELISQEDYDNLSPPDAGTLYLIPEAE